MKKTETVTKIDLLNAKGNSLALQDFSCEVLEVSGLAIQESVDRDTGELKEVAYLFTATGDVYGAISKTVIESVDNIIDAIENGDITLPIKLIANARKSKAGRDFLTIGIRK